MSAAPNMTDRALACAERGFRVFPIYERNAGGACACGRACDSPCKHPRSPHGLTDATTDAATIRQWWQKWPEANIGIATGGGLLVLDVDGDSAAESLRELEREYGDLPATATVRTGRPGGEHRYYRLPAGVAVRNASGKTLGKGLDVRGDGGYVCAPPSVHVTGSRYDRLPGCPRTMTEAPGWLLALLARRDEPPAAKTSPAAEAVTTVLARGLPSGRLAAAGEARLACAVERLRTLPREPGNGRGDQFYGWSRWVGGAVGARLLDHTTALEELRAAARALGLPEAHQAWRSIENGLRDGAAEPMSEANLPDRAPEGFPRGARGDTSAVNWPARLGDAAYHGLAGELVGTIEPHTEADPAAILASLLAAYGNVIGRGAGWKVGGTSHASNLYLLLVGPTSSGRKGTAGDEALRVFKMVDPEWVRTRVVNGLSSGEGLVWQVRDPIFKRRKAKKDEIPNLDDGWLEEIDDPGESDKRLFVVEAEFAQATKVMAREGNTLSPTLRRLWDTGDARSMVKTSPGKTTGALVSIAGHISAEELRRQLGDTEIANGFANRFMIVCSRRSKKLPFGGNLTDEELARFVPRLRDAIEHGRRCRELDMDDGARAIWTAMYNELDEEHFGMLGAVLRRAVPIVRRLAVIYALLDRQPIVREEHLRAAAAVWRYCEESARFVFGDALGYRMADKLRHALREARGAWLSREDIRKAVGSNNIAADEIDAALTVLLDHGLAERKSEPTGGRPAVLWRNAEAWEEWEESPSSGTYTPLSSHSSHEGAIQNGDGRESCAQHRRSINDGGLRITENQSNGLSASAEPGVQALVRCCCADGGQAGEDERCGRCYGARS